MFKNRTEAGILLAEKLRKFKKDNGVILAVPRGGIPVAYIVARELGFPLDIVLTKKIGHPSNKEYAIGAASLTDYFVIPHPEVTSAYIENELILIRNRLEFMRKKFMGDHKPEILTGKTVIIIDDGMATGNTLLSTVGVIKKSNPDKIIIGVPVASKSAIQKLSSEVDEVISLLVPEEFYGVGAFYDNFKEVGDDEVLFYLEKLKKLKKAG